LRHTTLHLKRLTGEEVRMVSVCAQYQRSLEEALPGLEEAAVPGPGDLSVIAVWTVDQVQFVGPGLLVRHS
jgi:hypothetical protein